MSRESSLPGEDGESLLLLALVILASLLIPGSELNEAQRGIARFG